MLFCSVQMKQQWMRVIGVEDDIIGMMSPREKRLVEDHGPSIALSTKRMLKCCDVCGVESVWIL